MSPSVNKSGASPWIETEGNEPQRRQRPQRAHDGALGRETLHPRIILSGREASWSAVVLYRFSSRRDARWVNLMPSPRLPPASPFGEGWRVVNDRTRPAEALAKVEGILLTLASCGTNHRSTEVLSLHQP